MKKKSRITVIGVRRFFSRLLFIAAIITAFFSLLILTAEHRLDEPPIAFASIALVILGYYSGVYVFSIFARRSASYQTKSLTALPLLSFFSLILLVLLFSLSNNHPAIVKVSIIIATLSFSFPLGLFIGLLYKKLTEQIAVARKAAAHSQSELQLLQSQLSPHFLFNTLNNLYGISLREPDKVPNMLLKLSELLRYSVYDAKDSFVPLKDEINYLQNYIAFEKIRIGERLELIADIEQTSIDRVYVPPMLFVVFVENAFKHAKNNLNAKIQIHISLKLWHKQVLFAVENSYKEPDKTGLINKHSGWGLQSTVKRLELLYPGTHDLQIQKQEGLFSVTLRLDARQSPKL